MIEHLFAAETAPFAIALGLMLLIAAIEGIGMLFGIAFSGIVDSALPDIDVPDADLDLDLDAEFDMDVAGAPGDLDAPSVPSNGPFTQLLGWLCVGRVPILVLLVAFLTAFGLSGLVVQGAAHGLAGVYLPSFLASMPALAAALPATRYLGLGLSKVMPKEETEAVSRKGFVGKIAVVTRGTAQRGLPAEAKLQDDFGYTHYVLVEPDTEGDRFEQGSEVLLVRQAGGGRFLCIENTHAVLSRD